MEPLGQRWTKPRRWQKGQETGKSKRAGQGQKPWLNSTWLRYGAIFLTAAVTALRCQDGGAAACSYATAGYEQQPRGPRCSEGLHRAEDDGATQSRPTSLECKAEDPSKDRPTQDCQGQEDCQLGELQGEYARALHQGKDQIRDRTSRNRQGYPRCSAYTRQNGFRQGRAHGGRESWCGRGVRPAHQPKDPSPWDIGPRKQRSSTGCSGGTPEGDASWSDVPCQTADGYAATAGILCEDASSSPGLYTTEASTWEQFQHVLSGPTAQTAVEDRKHGTVWEAHGEIPNFCPGIAIQQKDLRADPAARIHESGRFGWAKHEWTARSATRMISLHPCGDLLPGWTMELSGRCNQNDHKMRCGSDMKLPDRTSHSDAWFSPFALWHFVCARTYEQYGLLVWLAAVYGTLSLPGSVHTPLIGQRNPAALQRIILSTILMIGAHGSYDEDIADNIRQRGTIFGPAAGAAPNPAVMWQSWTWVTQHAGIPQPPPHQDQRWYLLRTMEPLAHDPPRALVWILRGSEAVHAMNRIEAQWTDLTPYDGINVHWYAHALHLASQESRTLTHGDWKAIVVSEDDEANMAYHAPVYYDVRKRSATGTTDEGTAIYAPRLVTVATFLEMIHLLEKCVKQFKCLVYLNGDLVSRAMRIQPGSYILVTMDFVDLGERSEDEMEEPQPIAAIRAGAESESSLETSRDDDQMSAHTPTQCEMLDMGETYHLYRPDFHRGHRRELIFVDTEQRTDLWTEVNQQWPDVRDTSWSLIPIHRAYLEDHPAEQSRTTVMVLVPRDYNTHPCHRGIVILFLYLHTRSTRAFPLETPTTLDRIWRWAGIDLQCSRSTAWSCAGYLNGDRLLPGMTYDLDHGDYLRIQVEEPRGFGRRGELLPLSQEEKERKEAAQGSAEHNRWPQSIEGHQVRPRPSSSSAPVRVHDHATYWIGMAWMMIGAGGALLRMQCPRQKGRTRCHTRPQLRKPVRSLFFLYLMISAHAGDALMWQMQHASMESGPCATTEPFLSAAVEQLRAHDPFELLPPPGNTSTGLQITTKGFEMIDWIVETFQLERNRCSIWQKLHGGGAPPLAPFLPIASDTPTSIFDFADVGSQVSLHVHAEGSTHKKCVSTADPPQAISLYAALPFADPTQKQSRNRDGSDHYDDDCSRQVSCFVTPWHPDKPPSLLHIVERHPCLQRDHLDPVCHDGHATLHVYTDGSYDPKNADDNATWAFAIFQETTDSGLRLVDWYADHVCYDPCDTAWTGAIADTIRAGESTALVWALLWLSTQTSQEWAYLRSDALSVLQSGKGYWTHALDDPMMQRLRATFMLTSTIWARRSLEITHVKAHAGHPGNELVDMIAGKVRSGQLEPRRPPVVFPEWFHGKPPPILQAWLLWDQRDRPGQLPPMRGQGLIPTKPECPTDMPTWLQLPEPEDIPGHALLRCATFNVHTLKQAGAVNSLRQQCEEHMIHLIGLQETRTPHALTTDTNYIRIVGEADHGQGGVELWVSKTRPLITDQHKTYFSREDILVLHSDATRLVTQLRILGRYTTCIVGHAPHRGHRNEDITTWWQLTDEILKKAKCKPPHILFLDANATVDVQQPYIGPLGAQEPDVGGLCLQTLCRTLEIALPGTFDYIHSGSTDTMYGYNATHRGTRNDYIGLSLQLLHLCVQSWTDDKLDAGHGKIDHAAVILDIQWPARSRLKLPPTVSFDRDKIGRATEAQWKEFFRDWPDIPWSTDVTSHVHIAEQYLQQQLAAHFPRDPVRQRHSCLSEATRDTLDQRCMIRKLMADTRVVCEQWMLKYAIQLWKKRRDLGPRAKLLAVMLRGAWRWTRYKTLSQRIKSMVKTDQSQWLATRMTELEQSTAKEVHKILRPLRMGKRVRQLGRKPLPQVRLLTGELATSQAEASQRWREHFSSMEGGRLVTQEAQWQAWKEKTCALDGQPQHLDELPTVYELEFFMRQSKSHKAMGHDRLPGELLRYAAPHLSYRMWPVLAKMAMWVDEPLQWKGGRLVTAYKQKGSAQECNSYRALLVSSSLGKSMHNVWRRRVYPFVQSGATSLQFSAQHRALVSQASHCARLFAYQAEQERRSCFLIFLDIQSAYYQLIRQHAIDLTFEDADIYQFLLRMGVDPLHVDDLARTLQQPSALEEQGCPSQLHRVVSEIHRATWWTLNNDAHITETSKGTRPGDGFADILWSLCFSKYLERLNECLTALGICRSMPWNAETGLLSDQGDQEVPGGAIVWADDAVITADHEDPHRMIPMLQTAMEVVITELLRLGMKPNMSKGKTEAMLILRGKDSRKVKQYVHCHCKGQVSLRLQQEEHQTLRIVPRYVHLGGVLTHDGRVKQEIRRRLAIAHDALQPYKSKVFCNPKVDLAKRVKLLQTTAIAALTYNVGTWPPLNGGELKLWRGGVLRLYKMVFKKLYTTEEQFHMTMDQVIGLTGLPSPELLLRVQRVKQFGHYLQRNCDYFWALAGQDHVWLMEVHRDLSFLHNQVQGFNSLPPLDEETGIREWQWQWRNQPAKIKSLLKRAQLHHTGQIQLHAEVDDFHDRIYRLLHEAGLRHPGVLEVETPKPNYCLICGTWWATFRAWAVHSFKTHGRLSKFRRLQSGSRCDACGNDYATHSRLCRHLRSSVRCAATLAAERKWVQAGLVTGNRTADRLDEEHSLIPSNPTFGPVLPQRQGWAMTEQVLSILKAFSKIDWAAADDPFTDDLMTEICRTAIHMTELNEIIDAQIHYYQNEVATGRLQQVYQDIEKNFKEQPLSMQHTFKPRLDVWSCELEDFHYIPVEPIPRPRTRHLYIVHLFSGTKREHDIHQCVNALTPPSGCTFLPISLDIVLDEADGNLMKRTTQEQWLYHAKCGRLHSVVAGPPCETWSISRWRWFLDGKGPRPIRKAECVWGLEVLRLRELKQLITGNCLLFFALLMAVAQMIAGNLAFIEHPSAADLRPEGLPPSIWRLDVMRVMLEHDMMKLFSFHQGLYGARSPKPTTLLIVCQPHMRQTIEDLMTKGRTTEVMPKPLSMGRTKTGFTTAPLKRYPPGLCRAIAMCIRHGSDTYPTPTSLPDGLSDVAYKFRDAYECTRYGAEDGQDFHCTA